MSRLIDLTGKKFGKLTVKSQSISRNRQSRWNCICDCGKETIVYSNDLKRGDTQSCGCIRRSLGKLKLTTHGMSDSAEFSAWIAMQVRCFSKKSRSYKRY